MVIKGSNWERNQKSRVDHQMTRRAELSQEEPYINPRWKQGKPGKMSILNRLGGRACDNLEQVCSEQPRRVFSVTPDALVRMP